MMVRKIIGITAALLVWMTGLCFAGDLREIEMNDGSIIAGELVSFGDGFFTVKTQSMGTLKLEESKVREIRMKGEGASKAVSEKAASVVPDVSAADVKALQQGIVLNPDAMSSIMSLKDDPEVKKLLEDPELMAAVQAGNYAAVLSNPNFLKLLANENVQRITGEIAGSQ